MAEAPDAAALAWLPLVGIAIGGIAGFAAWGTSAIAPQPFAIAVAFAGTVVLTGAVHVDGFLDSCDALAASVPPERRLEIMKDPRHGTFAVAGFAVLLAFWIAALAALPRALLPCALAFAGGSARFATVLNAYAIPYGRAGASSRAFEQRPPWSVLALMAGLVVCVALVARAPLWIAFAVVAIGIALGFGSVAARRLGGVLVGDVYGATIVVLDVAILGAIALLQGH
jgi:adenosylcobinamide-GDP ribazoletransferase